MPRPGSTPQGSYRRGTGPNALAQGEAQQLNEAPIIMPFDEQMAGLEGEDDEEFQPADDQEAFIFGQSGRPDEPVTAGLPYGAGPNITALPYESRADFVSRVANQLELETGNIPGLKKALAKLRKGL